MHTHLFIFMLFVCSINNVIGQQKKLVYAPSFRYCPDRKYDIAWENDLVAFRVYGEQPNKNSGLSGVDAWHKKVSYPILDKWYKANREGKTYHKDYGEGCDQFHVGKSRGVGGIGIWNNNKIIPSGIYKSWQVISQTIDSISFKLTYNWDIDGQKIKETRITTLKNGSHLYEAKSVFTNRYEEPMKDLRIAIGLSTKNSNAKTTLSPKKGWMSTWQELNGKQGKIGTGVIIEKKRLVKMLEQKNNQKDTSHVIAIVTTNDNGAITWKAGFTWEKAQRITTLNKWNSYLNSFIKTRK